MPKSLVTPLEKINASLFIIPFIKNVTISDLFNVNVGDDFVVTFVNVNNPNYRVQGWLIETGLLYYCGSKFMFFEHYISV